MAELTKRGIGEVLAKQGILIAFVVFMIVFALANQRFIAIDNISGHGTRHCCVEGRSGFDFEDSLPQGSSRCSNAFSPLCWKRYVRISA